MLSVYTLSSLRMTMLSSVSQVGVGMLDPSVRPYTFSFPVIESHKNFLGNRDCMHFQVGGQLWANDLHGRLYSNKSNSWHTIYGRTEEDTRILPPWGTYTVGVTAFPGHPVNLGQTIRIDDNDRHQNIPMWGGRYAVITDKYAVAVAVDGGVNVRPFSNNRFSWVVNCEAAVRTPDGWRRAVHPAIDTSEITLPEELSWKYNGHTIYPSRTYSHYQGVLAASGSIEAIKAVAESFPTFSEVIGRQVIQLFNRTIRDEATPHEELPGGYQELHGPSASIRFTSSYLSKLKQNIKEVCQSLRPEVNMTSVVSDATQSAADAARSFEGNTGMLIKELAALKGSLVDLYKLLQGNVNPKNLSSLYLNAKYGLRLTAQDTLSLTQSVIHEFARKNAPYSTARGSGRCEHTTCRCKIYYSTREQDAFSKTMFQLQSWDLFPSLQNVWDVIPYSFVADWFVDIEGFLEAIDARTFISTMDIISVLYSLKTSWDVDAKALKGHNLVGVINCSSYKRWSEAEPWPVVPSFSGGNPSNHIVEGSALIIQKL